MQSRFAAQCSQTMLAGNSQLAIDTYVMCEQLPSLITLQRLK
jgi:hypothetical protein